jgi:hypothetical protein
MNMAVEVGTTGQAKLAPVSGKKSSQMTKVEANKSWMIPIGVSERGFGSILPPW